MLCGYDTDPSPPAPDPDVPCCYGSALSEDGSGCTCWRPLYDRPQVSPSASTRAAGLAARTVPCRDCAYRPDSPERSAGDDPPGAARPFWCHQGMRRIVQYAHPALDLPHVPTVEGDHYAPPILDGIPYRADGRKAELCAGWLAQHAEVVDRRPLDEPEDPDAD